MCIRNYESAFCPPLPHTTIKRDQDYVLSIKKIAVIPILHVFDCIFFRRRLPLHAF